MWKGKMMEKTRKNDQNWLLIVLVGAILLAFLTILGSGCQMTKGALKDIGRAADYLDRSIVQPE